MPFCIFPLSETTPPPLEKAVLLLPTNSYQPCNLVSCCGGGDADTLFDVMRIWPTREGKAYGDSIYYVFVVYNTFVVLYLLTDLWRLFLQKFCIDKWIWEWCVWYLTSFFLFCQFPIEQASFSNEQILIVKSKQKDRMRSSLPPAFFQVFFFFLQQALKHFRAVVLKSSVLSGSIGDSITNNHYMIGWVSDW